MALTEIPIELSSTPSIVDGGNATAITIDSSENIGIGTGSPSYALTVQKDVDDYIAKIENDGNSTSSNGLWVDTRWNTATNTVFKVTTNSGSSDVIVAKGDGNVGIGTSSPSAGAVGGKVIHVQNSGGTASVRVDRSDAATSGTLSMTSANGSNGLFSTGAKPLVFSTNSTERMRIDSSGNLLVGKTSLAIANEGIVFEKGGAAEFTTDAARVMRLNRTSSDGSVLEINKDGTTVGQINSRSSDMVIGTGDTGLQFYDTGNSIFPLSASGNTNRDAAIDLGETSNRFKDLYLSGGVYLGGTAAGNKLDDYEEGSFTTVAAGVNGSGYNPTMRYTKVGSLVNITARILWTGTSNTTAGLKFTLPFDALATADTATGIVFYSGTAINAGGTISAYVAGGNVFFYSTAGGGFDAIKLNEVNGSYDFIFSVTYDTNE